MLSVPGASVAAVAFGPEGVVVELRLRARRLHCPCGWSSAARYDTSKRRWRHLDLGACRLWLEADNPPPRVPALWTGAHRNGALGAPRSPPQSRLRRCRCLVGAAHGQDQRGDAVVVEPTMSAAGT